MKKHFRTLFVLILGALLVAGWDYHPKTSATVPGIYSLISADASGTAANSTNNYLTSASVSGNGKEVVFESRASNLIPNDTNDTADIFVKDMSTGTITRVSVASDGTQANGPSFDAALSYDGRYIVFTSFATNLVANDTNNKSDIFIHDLELGTTQLVSTSSLDSLANQNSDYATVSADGRFVVFQSNASNLVSNTTATTAEIYEKDMLTGTTKLLSVNSSGVEADGGSGAPMIDCDGGVVVFSSRANNLGITANGNNYTYLDVISGGDNHVVLINPNANAPTGDSPAISCNGNDIVYTSAATNLAPVDNSGNTNTFEYDRLSQVNTLVSVMSDGTQLGSGSYTMDPVVSDDGRYVSFYSSAALDSNWTTGAVYIHDVRNGTTQAIGVASGRALGEYPFGMSADGAYVAFNPNYSSAPFSAGYGNLYTSETGF